MTSSSINIANTRYGSPQNNPIRPILANASSSLSPETQTPPSSSYNTHINSSLNYAPPVGGYSSYRPYHDHQPRRGIPSQQQTVLPVIAPPPYVDHNSTKKINSNVNVHKDTITLVLDENNLDCHLVSFTFDALVDGSITILYFAKEDTDCMLTPLYPEIYTPRRIPFHKGLGQKFSQPSGTGIDLGFFELDDLSKPFPKEDSFPLVIFAETCFPLNVGLDQSPRTNAQITEAVIEKNNEGQFQVKVIKQILWIDEVRYELHEIYGIGNPKEADPSDSDTGKECVICLAEPKDTAVLPCRHMCMCSKCAKELRLLSKKCPICRQPIQELIEIKVMEELVHADS